MQNVENGMPGTELQKYKCRFLDWRISNNNQFRFEYKIDFEYKKEVEELKNDIVVQLMNDSTRYNTSQAHQS